MQINANSPLENLAAFAIAFVAGIVCTTGLGLYIKHVRKEASENGHTSLN